MIRFKPERTAMSANTRKLSALLLMLALAVSGLGVRFEAGRIDSVKGTASLQRPKGKPITLDAKSKGIVLYSGDKVRIRKGNAVTVKFRDGNKRPLAVSADFRLVPLVRTPQEERLWTRLTGGGDPTKAAVKAAVKKKGGRAPEPLEFEPTSARFFAAIPPAWAKETYRLRVFANYRSEADPGELLFDQSVSANGPYRSAALSEALRKRQRPDDRLSLALVTALPNGERAATEAVFLMSQAEERELNGAIAAARLGRDAYSFEIALIDLLHRMGFERTAAWRLATLKEQLPEHFRTPKPNPDERGKY